MLEMPKPKPKGTIFDVKEKSKLFEVVDKFRELGIHEDISLPQLVVVGDQSSGKSSLLEALTALPFPVAGTICTRFATQIVFRRTSPGEAERIKVTIIPDENGTEEQKERLRAWKYDVDESLTPDEFKRLILSASDAMGLPKPGETTMGKNSGPRFSDDLLKIELASPTHDHFSVVDVPGIFQAATVFQTTEDVEMIERLVKRYISDKRTIILAVASSLHETANQKVFRLAEVEDPNGLRTLGILTKPDAVQKGDEQRIIDVARNKVTELTHGWFVIRNRSTDDINNNVSLEKRNQNEAEFFKKSPWNQLHRDRVGIFALNKFLRELLDEHVKKEFPGLVSEMNKLITNAEDELAILGPRRETPDEQRRMLLRLAMKYQGIALNAILGNYRDDFFNANPEFKLRMQIANYSDEFAQQILTHGHQMEFDDIQSHKISDDTHPIYSTILNFYHSSRGAELPGMVNPIVVQNLFKWQSTNWRTEADEYVQKIQDITNKFIASLLSHVCPKSTDFEQKIAAKLAPALEKAYERGNQELLGILESEREGLLLTLDDTYTVGLQNARKQRQMLALRTMQNNHATGLGNLPDAAQLTTILNAISLSHEKQSVADIHDILRAYYFVARKRFVDNVAVQVVERHYLSRDTGSGMGSWGPAMCFSAQWVGELTVDELEQIAGEDRVLVNKRAQLVEKLEKWRKARSFAGGLW
ncbi:P-loop containing nucleoside triphosphate hydrolase protein [Peziza echinospora]|nr:P-loop containing nucleoside triphosphate hydrolase protein [Peziza echinospora]